MEILRKDVLGMTREQVAVVLDVGAKTIYLIERSEEDRIAFHQIRALYRYAQAKGIPWPKRLLMELLDRDDAPGH